MRNKNPFNVLVIEDNPGDFAIVEQCLKERLLHPAIVHAGSFRKAMALLETNSDVDVILMDLTLPDTTGEDMTRELLARGLSCPVIILTGYNDLDFSITSISQGVSDYLIKADLNAGMLYKSISYAIQRKRTELALRKSEEELRALFAAMTDLVVILDATGRYVKIAPTNALSQYEGSQDLVGKRIHDVLATEEAEMIVQKIGLALSTSQVVNVEYKVLLQNEEVWFEGIFSRLSDNMVLWVGRDITERRASEQQCVRDLAERREAEKRVKQSEANLRQIIDLIPHFIFVRDEDEALILINKRFAESYGYQNVHDLTGKKMQEAIPAKEQGKVFSLEDREVLLSGKPRIIPQSRFTDYTGKERIFHTTKVPYTLPGTNRKAVLGIALEITDQIKADQELKNAEGNYREIFDKASDGIFILDFDSGNIVNANQKAAQLTGYTVDELINLHPSDLSCLSPGYTAADANKKIKEVAGGSQIFEWHIKQKDQSMHWMEVSCSFVNIGGTDRLISFFHQIEDRKQTEDALRKSEEELRALFAAMTDVVMVLDAQGRFVSIGPTNPLNLYKPTQNLVGKHIYQFLPPDDAQKVIEHIELVLSGLRPINFEYKLFIGSRQVWFDSRLSLLTSDTVFWIARDITEQKLLELERNKTTYDLIQRNKDLEQFTYIVSHNLRAPLANIIGIADAMYNIKLEPEEQREMASDLNISVEKLDGVIKDLNHILQVKGGTAEKKQVVRFADLLANIRVSIENIIRKERVHIITDFSQVAEMMTIKSYFYSVFFNLISNSIKYRQPLIDPVIEITTRKTDCKIELVFKDNGLGIDLGKRREQVFGLYKRFHSHVEGKGMGLFMVKTQVENLGGSISIKSQINKGTEFVITFER